MVIEVITSLIRIKNVSKCRNDKPVCQQNHSAFELKTDSKSEFVCPSFGMTKYERITSMIKSSAKIRVIKRDQKPDGKYVINNKRWIECFGLLTSDNDTFGVNFGVADISVSVKSLNCLVVDGDKRDGVDECLDGSV